MQKSVISAAALGAAVLLSAPCASAQTWTGPYLGGHLGYSFLSESDDESLSFDTNLDGTYGDTVRTAGGANAFSPGFCDGKPNSNNAAAGCGDDEGGVDVGVRAGYDWEIGGFVAGVVGELAYIDLEDSATGFSTTPAAYSFTRELNSLGALRGRIGYPWNDTLFYGTAGFAWGDVERSFATTNTANSFTARDGDDAHGYQIGAGAERMLGDRWALGVEYLYTSLDDEGYTVRVGPGTAPPTNPFLLVNSTGTDMRRSDETFNFSSVRVTMSYRFGS